MRINDPIIVVERRARIIDLKWNLALVEFKDNHQRGWYELKRIAYDNTPRTPKT